MRVMYWNCTAPGISGDLLKKAKLDTIGKLVRHVEPDILCLDEVSNSVSDISSANHFAVNCLDVDRIGYDAKSVVANPGVHLNSVGFIKSGVAGLTVAKGLPSKTWDSEKTKRDLIRFQFTPKPNKKVSVWFIHANASYSGGKTATTLACEEVEDSYSAIIGDFNCPIKGVTSAAAATVAPVVGVYNFTQWKVDDYGTKKVPGPPPPKRYTPHSTIDFAIVEDMKLTLTPVNTLGHLSDEGLRRIFLSMDHFPIAYDVTAR